MKKMTREYIVNAFQRECENHFRSLLFAEKAEAEGKTGLARIFKAVAFAERIHARIFFELLDVSCGSDKNLMKALEVENFDIEEHYPACDAVAKLQGERRAIESIHRAIEAEKTHALLYGEAKELTDESLRQRAVSICPGCGSLINGDEEVKECFVCFTPADRFVKF